MYLGDPARESPRSLALFPLYLRSQLCASKGSRAPQTNSAAGVKSPAFPTDPHRPRACREPGSRSCRRGKGLPEARRAPSPTTGTSPRRSAPRPRPPTTKHRCGLGLTSARSSTAEGDRPARHLRQLPTARPLTPLSPFRSPYTSSPAPPRPDSPQARARRSRSAYPGPPAQEAAAPGLRQAERDQQHLSCNARHSRARSPEVKMLPLAEARGGAIFRLRVGRVWGGIQRAEDSPRVASDGLSYATWDRLVLKRRRVRASRCLRAGAWPCP